MSVLLTASATMTPLPTVAALPSQGVVTEIAVDAGDRVEAVLPVAARGRVAVRMERKIGEFGGLERGTPRPPARGRVGPGDAPDLQIGRIGDPRTRGARQEEFRGAVPIEIDEPLQDAVRQVEIGGHTDSHADLGKIDEVFSQAAQAMEAAENLSGPEWEDLLNIDVTGQITPCDTHHFLLP